MRVRVGALVAAATAVAAATSACGASTHHPPVAAPTAAVPSVTPTTPAPRPPRPPARPRVKVSVRPTTTPAVRPVAAGPPACTLAHLSVTFPAVNSGTGGQQAAFLELRNTGTVQCDLAGRPVVTMLDRAGRPLATHDEPSALYADEVVELPAGTAATVPDRPNPGHGYVTVLYNAGRDGSRLCTAAQIVTPAYLQLTIPGQPGTAVVPAAPADGSGQRVQACDGALGVTDVATLREVQQQ